MNTPALYAADMDNLLDIIFERMRQEGLVIRQEPDKALTISQAAERLSFTTDHIRRLIDDGVLPATNYASPGSSRAEWRIFESDLKNLKRYCGFPAVRSLRKHWRESGVMRIFLL